MSNCSIAKTGRRLIAFLLGLFFYATQDLTRQSNGIVFIHPFDDALDQAAKRSLDQWFRYTDHVYIILLEHAFDTIDSSWLRAKRLNFHTRITSIG